MKEFKQGDKVWWVTHVRRDFSIRAVIITELTESGKYAVVKMPSTDAHKVVGIEELYHTRAEVASAFPGFSVPEIDRRALGWGGNNDANV